MIRLAPVDLESAVTLLKQNQPCHLVCERHRRQADSRVRPSDYLRCQAVVTAGLKSAKFNDIYEIELEEAIGLAN